MFKHEAQVRVFQYF